MRNRKDSNYEKIVINRSHDKFSVSHEAFLRFRELGQPDALKKSDPGAYWPEVATPREPSLNQCGQLIPRDDQKLVQVVEELGAAANGHGSELRVVAIPDDVRWEISAVGGIEHISELHRTWS